METGKEDIKIQLAVFIVLLLGLSFVLVHFNVVSCGFYSPAGCEIYYGIVAGGKPKVLIVHGTEGIGDSEKLFDALRSPKIGARVSVREIDAVSLRLLQDYQLVIVEQASRMSTSEMRMFQEYVTRGGRLVWIGDAGTKAPETEVDANYFLRNSDRKLGANMEFIGPWARRSGDKQVSFDYTLGVQFIGNYCKLKECDRNEITGFFDFPNQGERLSNGLKQGLDFYGDFSVVKLNDSGYQKAIAFLNYGPNLTAQVPSEYFWLSGNRNFGKTFPMIISSGVGGRVAYYSFPPEYLVGENMPVDRETGQRIAYWGILENMYYGMLFK